MKYTQLRLLADRSVSQAMYGLVTQNDIVFRGRELEDLRRYTEKIIEIVLLNLDREGFLKKFPEDFT